MAAAGARTMNRQLASAWPFVVERQGIDLSENGELWQPESSVPLGLCQWTGPDPDVTRPRVPSGPPRGLRKCV